MSRDPRYDALFEPVAIGPVTGPQTLLRPGARRELRGAPPMKESIEPDDPGDQGMT